VNGSNVGTNSATFTSNALSNNDVVTCDLTSNATCATTVTATSGGITLQINSTQTPSVTISITAGNNPSCPGSGITFTATPANGGSSPSYQWKVNGTDVGTNSTIYTSNTLTDGQVVTCVMTSNATCASPLTATSNAITRTTSFETPSVSIFISNGSNPTCSGNSVTFTASGTNGGSSPSYQWKVDGVNAGTNLSSYTTTTLTDGQTVTCEMTSSSSCASPSLATSTGIVMDVTTTVTPTVTIALTSGTNPSCQGTEHTFTASTSVGGYPAYQWVVNGANVGVNSNTYTYNGNNNDAVSVTMTTIGTCTTSPSVNSNTINLSVLPVPLANAGVDQYITMNSSNISGNTPGAGQTGVWSTTGSATITSPNGPSSNVTGLVTGANTFTWTVSNSACSASDNVVIHLGSNPSPVISGPSVVTAGHSNTYSVIANAGSTYTWTVPAGATITSNSGNSITVVFDLGEDGNVAVSETNSFGTGSSTLAVTVHTSTGIFNGQVSSNEYSVYPNPFTDHITVRIESNKYEQVKLTVMDAHGVIVYASNEYFTNQNIVLSKDLPVGVLVIHAICGEQVKQFKVVKVE
jgi:hypothetical protein